MSEKQEISKVTDGQISPTMQQLGEFWIRRIKNTVSRVRADVLEIGICFKHVLDMKLYKCTHTSFEDYCQCHARMSEKAARRLVEHAETMCEDFLAVHPEGLKYFDAQIPQGAGIETALVLPSRRPIWDKVREYFDSEFAGASRLHLKALEKVEPEFREEVWAEVKRRTEEGDPIKPRTIHVVAKEMDHVMQADPVEEDFDGPPSEPEGAKPASTASPRNAAHGKANTCTHVDCIGQTIPEHLLPVFRGVSHFQNLRRIAQSWRDETKDLMVSCIAPRLQQPVINHISKNLNELILACPYCVCLYCYGDKLAMKRCKGCVYSGWMSRLQHKFLPNDMKLGQGKAPAKNAVQFQAVDEI